MTALAGDFASSPAGYVISVLVVILIGIVGFGGRQVISTQREHGAALTETIKSLAVLINDHGHVTSAVTEAVADIDDLQSAVKVLQTWRDIHDRTVATGADALAAYVTRRQTPAHPKRRALG